MTVLAGIPPERWRREFAARLESGARFSALYGGDDGRVRCVLILPSGLPVVMISASGADVRSIVDLAPAADWAEREAHDLYGIRFEGHDPMRSLVNHRGEWLVPVTGEGVHEIAVGPIHAGIIESGHFRIHAVGDLMLLVDLRMFYKHRGLERAAESSGLGDGIRFAQRACAGCAVSNSIAYALAAEQLLGVEVSPEITRARTVLLELERVWNHLNDLSAICAGVGFAVGSMAFAALKEGAQRLNQRLFGHRFLFDTVAVGSGSGPLSAVETRDALTTLRDIAVDLRIAWRAVAFNASVQERLRGTGVLTHRAASRGGAVGPAARASGVAIDARTYSPGLHYPDFRPSVPRQAGGDVAARTTQRHTELLETFELLGVLLADRSLPRASGSGSVEPHRARSDGGAGTVAVGRVEGPRGETVCCLEAGEGDSIRRAHLRTASYANWPLVGEAAAGNLVGEFPLINKSFELCYACVDR